MSGVALQVLVMIGLMIPVPRISIAVIGTIFLAIIDIVGLLYFWGVTICGVSTIYILICVGLAVDYSAHIAHMFKEVRVRVMDGAAGCVLLL
jgi:Niemann-Pick C1 protein